MSPCNTQIYGKNGGINTANGCRAASTLLIAMYLQKIPFSVLDGIDPLPVVYSFSEEIRNQREMLLASNFQIRRSKRVKR